MAYLIATKVYRPESVSIAGMDIGAHLADHWRHGTNLKIEGNSDAEKLHNRALLRAGSYNLTYAKRPGHFILHAWTE